MIRVGVLRGGTSTEHEVSLSTGEHILSHFKSDKLKDSYTPLDIYIDKSGLWHSNGLPTTPEQLVHKVDLMINALHGEYGEDGKVQKILDGFQIPYTGSGAMASAIGFNKALSKEAFARLGIQTPQHILYPAYQIDFDGPREEYAIAKAHEVMRKMPPPYIVKPLTGGSSMGIHVCKTFDELVRAFRVGVGQNVSILVEELIEGKEATVGVIDGFRGQETYVLPPIEIRLPSEKTHFDYEAKYNGASEEICPGNFSMGEKEELVRLASLIHTGLNLDHYSRSDFILHPKKGIYAIEVNTLPGLTEQSLIPKALIAVGSSMPEFLEHLIARAYPQK